MNKTIKSPKKGYQILQVIGIIGLLLSLGDLFIDFTDLPIFLPFLSFYILGMIMGISIERV